MFVTAYHVVTIPLTQLYSRLIMAAMSGLGKSVLLPTTLATNLNPKVVVRRKDTTIHTTTLIDEHIRQLTTDFPDYLEKFIKLPPSYEFEESRLHHIHGFPHDMNPTTNQEREWRKVAIGFSGEQQLFNMMSRTFANKKGSVMISGFKPEQLFQIARQTMEHQYTE